MHQKRMTIKESKHNIKKISIKDSKIIAKLKQS
jgi:hypothetical protein